MTGQQQDSAKPLPAVVDASRLPSVAGELARIADAMPQYELPQNKYCQLFAAQQASIWVIDPKQAAEPCDVILNSKVQPLTGIQED
jgi:hypothetical protein